MVTAVSLNPSIDKTSAIAGLTPGGLNRVKESRSTAAGKGLNVALAASALGYDAKCIGFMYEEGASAFTKRMEENSVGGEFVTCPGAVRVNLKVFDTEKSEITEFNEGGTPVDEAAVKAFLAMYEKHLATTDFVVLAGSLPPGCPVDIYRTLVAMAKAKGVKAALDADGERMRLGLQAGPTLIKPNKYELELLTGKTIADMKDIQTAAAQLLDGGVGVVAVSMGGDGAFITDGTHSYRGYGLKIDVKSTVAAGDSMVAGLTCGLGGGASLEEAFRMSIACSAARCATAPELPIDHKLYDKLLKETVVEAL